MLIIVSDICFAAASESYLQFIIVMGAKKRFVVYIYLR